jgi:hypothetical protein
MNNHILSYSVKNEVKDILLKVKKITVLKWKTFGALSESLEYE